MSTEDDNIDAEFDLSAGEKKILYGSSLEGATGPLTLPPFGASPSYDSVKVIFSEGSELLYLPNNCDQHNNPLCESSYELVKDVDNKEEKIRIWNLEY
ncbi:hypothetical protein [Persicobacter sp. CCB-QB2]|uniref:hypothetical protein n=1 Tax=Persicobacter sp. CCB-QB2 TaxID=1561025 RepID=UPI0012F83C73|nr:hypothetical protein [Persicobacter sp. CCB-QB2]